MMKDFQTSYGMPINTTRLWNLGKKQMDIDDPDRHIKLINIAGKEVFVVTSVYWFDTDISENLLQTESGQ